VSSGSDTAAVGLGLKWDADLTLEHAGVRAARLVSNQKGCVLEIDSISAFRNLTSSLTHFKTLLGEEGLRVLAGVLPPSLEIVLHGTLIGRYEPCAPLNWTAQGLGLPFGNLAIDKLELLRASLKGG
jgi:hypothetical protein